MREVTDPELLCRNRLARAQRGDESAFAQLADPYRRELQLHCYRILGSLQDAEDLLQETLLAAWRGDADRKLAVRFADAFERDDIDLVVALLTDDAVVSMPPQREWHAGRATVERFLRERHMARRGAPWRFVATGANGQPAYAYYVLAEGRWERSGLFVMSVREDGVESVTRFHDGGLLSRFGVPETL
jgi:hypothetical protein